MRISMGEARRIPCDGLTIGRMSSVPFTEASHSIALQNSMLCCYEWGMTEPSTIVTTALRPLPRLIFATRWLQLPLYLGLAVAQCVYVVLFLKELVELILHFNGFDEREIMLVVLGLIDVVMISNLLVMVIVGGYETFVSRLGLAHHPDQPEWLSHVNSGVLKIKLAMAIVGISSIHLLRTFIGANKLGMPDSHITSEGVMWQAIIHCIFILSAIGIAWVDRMSTAPGHHGVPPAAH